MRISDSLAEALAKWSYCHGSRVEVSDKDREKAVEELLRALRQEDRVRGTVQGRAGPALRLAPARAVMESKATGTVKRDWGCGGGQGMTGQDFGWLGIKDGVGFAPGGNRG
jgi:hypothetical protein